MAASCTLAPDRGEICIRFTHNQRGTWFRAKDDLRDNVPGSYFDDHEKAWFVDIRFRAQVRLWAERWFSPSEITDHLGGRDYEGTPRQPIVSSVGDAYRTLYLVPGAPLWAAEGVFRAAAKVLHPDVGGTHAGAVAINSAIALLRKAAS